MEQLTSILIFNAFDSSILIYLLLIVLLLLCSSFLSASETALFSLSPGDMDKIKSHKSTSNSTILALLESQDYLLATILFGNNLANISVVVVANKLMDTAINFSGSPGVEFVVKVVIVTFLLLLFGEIMPKLYAANNALRVSQFTAIPLQFLGKILKPVSYILVYIGGGINNRFSKNRHVNISMNELSSAIKITKPKTDEEKQILSGIVNFVNTEVAAIMKPRMDVISIDVESDYKEVKRVIVASGYSRIPVFEETLDNIKGVLYIKDLLPYIDQTEKFSWQVHLRKPFFVPENRKISDLLEDFQSLKIHVAIVVDEYGSTVGLVSLEDILEEIVGEIMDESDNIETANYIKINDNTFVFDGKAHLNDLHKVLEIEEDFFDTVRGGAETVGGLMMEIKRDFLKEGETIVVGIISLTAQSIEGRRIDKVKVVVDR